MLTGEAKKVYQCEYMKSYRAKRKTQVRPHITPMIKTMKMEPLDVRLDADGNLIP